MTRITEPMVIFDERRAINRVAIWVALVRQRLDKGFSREWLETTLRRYLRGIDVPDATRLTIAIKAVEAADKGDEIADAALREVGSELIEQADRSAGRRADRRLSTARRPTDAA